MSEQNFKFEENNKAWEGFVKYRIEFWDKKFKDDLEKEEWTKDDKRIYSDKINGEITPEEITPYKYHRLIAINSYGKKKKYILNFEEFVGKEFSKITYDDYSNFLIFIKNKHGILEKVRRFLFECVSIGIIENNDKNFLVLLLPDEYKEFVKRNFIE